MTRVIVNIAIYMPTSFVKSFNIGEFMCIQSRIARQQFTYFQKFDEYVIFKLCLYYPSYRLKLHGE